MATLLQPNDLTDRGDFLLGQCLVRPASRELHGAGGHAMVEPRVMQVLVTLADAAGEVVTRSQLIRHCWNSQIVGEDAVTRAIGEVRRLARTVAAGDFGVETITKAGYRLVGASPAPAAARNDSFAAPAAPPFAMSRRMLLAIGVIGTVGAAFMVLSTRPTDAEKRAAALLDMGAVALRDGLPDSEAQGLGFLREAVALDPQNPEAWGKLALAWSGVAEHAPPAQTAEAVRGCETAARRALALDRRQSDAHVAMALLTPYFGDWGAAEQRLTATLAVAPANPALLSALGVLMAGVGRMRAAGDFFGRAMAIEPLSPVLHFRRTFQLWNDGKIGEADRFVDRAMQLWPRHPALWNVRLILFAFTGRPAAALAMLDDEAGGRPIGLPTQAVAVWRISLAALASRRTEDIERAIQAQLAAALTGGPAAINAILVLTQLGALNEAFAVADGYLLRRGPLIGQLRTGPGQLAVNDQRRRKTMMLFTAAAAPMRADERFGRLCADIGLADYWLQARVRPDYQVNSAA